MSYCRFIEADAYAFPTRHEGKLFFECCGCWLDEESFFDTAEGLFWHLVKHRLAGHSIPDDALWEVMDDALTGRC